MTPDVDRPAERPDEGFASAPLPPRLPRFCWRCGNALDLGHLPEEDRPRHHCRNCGHIHYLNPTLVAAVIPEHDGRVLLLCRARAPRAGSWVFPGGFVEWGETAEAAAAREVLEEVGVPVTVDAPPLGLYSRLGPGVVVAVYRGRALDPRVTLGQEATDARWFAPDAIPWHDLAFDTTVEALRDWLRATGHPLPGTSAR